MKPVITHHNGVWRVHVGNHLTGVWATKERAQKHARNIETSTHQETRHHGTRTSRRSTTTHERTEARMTIGSDQLDEWGRRLIECDELYREVQLLTRLNPEGCTDDAFTVVGVANADGREDADLLHPVVFARRWAWYLAAENRSIPPITNQWVPLVRFISAHLQYLAAGDREDFAHDLKRVRGLLGAIVNENGLSQGEEVTLSALRGRDARAKIRAWARTSDQHMTRADLSIAFPELDKSDWLALRVRKVRSTEEIPTGHYPAHWVASRGNSFDSTPVDGRKAMGEDVYDDLRRVASLNSIEESTAWHDEEAHVLVLADGGKRKTQEPPENM